MFNALDLMENKEFLEKLKFGIGDGNLQYYLYNWKCPYMEPTKVSYSAMTLLRLIFLDPCLIRRKKKEEPLCYSFTFDDENYFCKIYGSHFSEPT